MEFSLSLILFFAFVFFAVLQLFYFLFFYSRLAFYKKKNTLQDVSQNLPITLIVCASNEDANLRKNLSTWLNQQYHLNGKPNFEVLVVNDNSEDDSFYFLNEMEKIYPHLHVVHLIQKAKLIPGKKFALSMGIKSAKNEHLLLTDADCTPASEHWLATMVSNFSAQHKIVLGYGAYTKYDGLLNKMIRFETMHTAMQYLSFALAKMPYMGVGRNLAYNKSLFIKNKGFSSHHHIISGDDDLFVNQVADNQNTSIEISPESFTYSEPKKSKAEWKRQKTRHLGTGKFYKTKHKILLATYAFSLLFFWISLLPFVYFHEYILYALGLFLFREMILFFVYYKVCKNLHESDLTSHIFLFDFWLILYHIKNLNTIFYKTHQHWK